MTVSKAEKARRKARAQARIQRRHDAWMFRTREFLTQEEIAKRLGVNQSTISRDLRAAAENTLRDLDEAVRQTKLEQVAQLSTIVEEAMAAWLASKENAKTVIRTVKNTAAEESPGEDGEDSKTVITTRVAGKTGDICYLNTAMRALADIRKILGAEAPLESSVTIVHEEKVDYSTLSDEELQSILAQ